MNNFLLICNKTAVTVHNAHTLHQNDSTLYTLQSPGISFDKDIGYVQKFRTFLTTCNVVYSFMFISYLNSKQYCSVWFRNCIFKLKNGNFFCLYNYFIWIPCNTCAMSGRHITHTHTQKQTNRSVTEYLITTVMSSWRMY